MIERTFKAIQEGKIEESENRSYLAGWGLSSGTSWQDLLQSKRVLIVSEAGSGKTYECQEKCKQLWNAGEASFYLELAALASGDLRSMLTLEEEKRFDEWLLSQSEVATFFLDSYDELKLSLGSFEQALKRLAKPISGRLERARIVITTRPIPFDELLVRRLLPMPEPTGKIEANGKTFAQIALHGSKEKSIGDNDEKGAPDWSTVALLPFSDEQIVEFARLQGVSNPDEMLADLKRRNAQEFARRPQDLIELSADWRDYKRIRTHSEQVAGSIRIKLKPREDRREPAELSVEKAMDGASRLALAMMMTRRLTIRHSAESDRGGTEAAFDPGLILADWTAAEIKALLERALFGVASYGRVRFHHRSVMEYLASDRLRSLRAGGMSAAALRRLTFIQTKGKTIVRHSKRAIAGWLALREPMVFETLRDNEPDVLLNEGDPESLSTQQRIQALCAFVERHSKGGWRGLNVPHIQIHRFASSDLSGEIIRLWDKGIDNPEIRKILLRLVELGKIYECSDIAFGCASSPKSESGERLAGIDALAALNDASLPGLVNQIASDSPDWSERLTRIAVMRLFPKHMSIAQFFEILPRLKSAGDSIGDLKWYLPRVISDTEWQIGELETVRDGLMNLISEDLKWDKEWPNFFSSKSYLGGLLAVTCIKGHKGKLTTEWLHASILALLWSDGAVTDNDVFSELTELLNSLSAIHSRELFWKTDQLAQSLHQIDDPWERFIATTMQWNIRLERERDLDWIKNNLADTNLCEADRAMVLQGATRLGPGRDGWPDHMNELRNLVSDLPKLVIWIKDQIKQTEKNPEPKEWEIKAAKRKEEAGKKEAENLASWEDFWKQVSKDPEGVFSDEKEGNTAWNLWCAMSKAGSRGRESGWNRQFIEDYLGKDIADRLRLALMRQWRKNHPTLTSERSEDTKGTFLMIWQLGLAGIYAESEDTLWARQLSSDEARLATRYATIALNSLPPWMDALVKEHPAEVEETLGNELVTELSDKTEKHFHSMLLQNIGHSTDPVTALFLPRIRSWLSEKPTESTENDTSNGEMEQLIQVTRFLANHGDSDTESYLCELARKHLAAESLGSYSRVWLPLLLKYDAKAGIEALETRFQSIAPSQRSGAVTLLGSLFGERRESINFSGSQFTPAILLRLMQLIYQQVRPVDDVHHTGTDSPDERDDAEWARNSVVNVLLTSKGEDAWAAKLEMAADPLCAHFKDRILAMAEESWAEEVDADAYNDQQVIALDQSGEAPPTTNEAMFTLMVNRLEEIDDLLTQDISPWESWASNTTEKVMRREIARELKNRANGLYKVDQESVTADEKETDIRLRSTASDHEAIIELKLSDERTAHDLLNTLENQLVIKYMASEKSRSGCLLITLSKEKKFENPNGRGLIDFSDVLSLLRKKAEQVVAKYRGAFRLHIHGFDLRPRLPTESGKIK